MLLLLLPLLLPAESECGDFRGDDEPLLPAPRPPILPLLLLPPLVLWEPRRFFALRAALPAVALRGDDDDDDGSDACPGPAGARAGSTAVKPRNGSSRVTLTTR